MLAIEPFPSPTMFNQAEDELGAYLHATVDIVGLSGLYRAAGLWIEAMKTAGCPGPDMSKFLRSVTIRAIAQLTQENQSWIAPPGQSNGRVVTIAA